MAVVDGRELKPSERLFCCFECWEDTVMSVSERKSASAMRCAHCGSHDLELKGSKIHKWRIRLMNEAAAGDQG